MVFLAGRGDACLRSQLIGRLRQEDCLRLAVPAQLKQHSKTLSKRDRWGEARRAL